MSTLRKWAREDEWLDNVDDVLAQWETTKQEIEESTK